MRKCRFLLVGMFAIVMTMMAPAAFGKTQIVMAAEVKKPGQANITEVTRRSYNTLRISWKKVSGATGYGIYKCDTPDGTYTRIGKVTKGSTLSYDDKNCISGKVNYYKVAAYKRVDGTNYYGMRSDAVEQSSRPGRVNLITKSTRVGNTAKLSWKKISGASGYEVQRRQTEEGEYELIATIKKGSAITYTDKELSTDVDYYYRARSYCTVNGIKVYGGYSDSYKAPKVKRPDKTSITAVTRKTYNTLEVSWEKVSGATGYGIYKSDAIDGTYTRIAKVTKGTILSYQDTNCISGKVNYYKVAAYKRLDSTNFYATKSDAAEGYSRPGRVSLLTKSTHTVNSAQLGWKSISGAHGYEIYRSMTEEGEYARIATVKGGSTVTYTDKGLSTSRDYYYKARSYRDVDGNRVYGGYSDPYHKSPGAWKYKNGYKLYYDTKGKLVKDVRDIIGEQSNYVIRVNKQKCTVTVYAKDGSNGYIIPVVAFICSPGEKTPLGTFYTQNRYRWCTLMGPSYGQWCTRITGSFLFHSVFYREKNDNTTLTVSAYNKLGTIASHGCIRLTAEDAKWIYDNCVLKTKVIIYNSSTAGPLGKPTAFKLDKKHKWDPTDPNMKQQCIENGCHWVD